MAKLETWDERMKRFAARVVGPLMLAAWLFYAITFFMGRADPLFYA